MRVLFAFYVLLGLCNTLPNSNKYVMEPKGFMRYLKRGSACELSNFWHQHITTNHGIFIREIGQNGPKSDIGLLDQGAILDKLISKISTLTIGLFD